MWSCPIPQHFVSHATTRSTVATACRLRKAILENRKKKKKKEAKGSKRKVPLCSTLRLRQLLDDGGAVGDGIVMDSRREALSGKLNWGEYSLI